MPHVEGKKRTFDTTILTGVSQSAKDGEDVFKIAPNGNLAVDWDEDGDFMVSRQHIPLFDAHEEYKDDDLKEIAQNCNRRYLETGDAIPICIGHTTDQKDEKSQPEIVGYGVACKVGRFGKSETPTIGARFRIKKAKFSEAMTYPRRSVELWTKDKIIDPIALLRRTPERDLGLLTFQKRYFQKTGHILRYMGDDMAMPEAPLDAAPALDPIAAPPPNPMVQKVMAALMAALPAALEAALAPEATAPALDTGTDALDDGAGLLGGEEPTMMAADGGEDDLLKESKDMKGGDKIKCEAAFPSGGNTFVPGADKKTYSRNGAGTMTKTEPKAGLADEDRVRIQRNQDQIRLSKIEKENQELRESIKTLKERTDASEKHSRLSSRESELTRMQLEEGYEFDLVEELDDTADLDDKGWEKHVGRIRRRYAKAPVGEMIPVRRTNATGKQSMSRERQREIADYATNHNCSFEEAEAKLSS